MSGHSKWATIKRKKGALDQRRGALFTKLVKIIEVAARGGADPAMNFKLKLAVQKAKSANVPLSTIDKAIKKGSGQDKEASRLEEVTYEGLAPGNVAVIVQALTDNKNRTVSDLRNIFNKSGATFGTQVGWQFENRGVLEVSKSGNIEDLELATIDAGALDFSDAGDVLEVYTEPKLLDQVKNKLEANGFKVTSSALSLVPKSKTVITDPNMARRVLNFLDAIDEYDDVTEVASTLDVP
ncbi:TPA: YebC/PmpR family DNA-binding transcriptional regulator, partial [Patescibacteria group bacterium]|nr:YebC/PmpR family DNA-binding transcriptional regulator [Patescibacteria group bacterium]